MSQIKDAIRQYIRSNHLKGALGANLQDTTRLQTSGLLDSLALMDVISYIEQTYGIKFKMMELLAENFDSLEMIGTLVLKKSKGPVVH
jgi:acyl carrier protein